MSEADPIAPHVQVLVKVAELIASFDSFGGDKAEALSALTAARDGFAALLDTVRARSHVSRWRANGWREAELGSGLQSQFAALRHVPKFA